MTGRQTIRIRDIDFPPKILDAQRDGELVVFAGAGVSMGPPADYPDFNGLVRKIARGTKLTKQRHESLDHFLGRLEKSNVKVQQLTRELLRDPKSQPNPLHGSLVMLFASGAPLRLVTTNFDTHFSIEAERILGAKPETFCAPALPVGSRFQGLVYIHGSVENSERLILTDGDFGRAYLTEGWARQFLLDLYAKYVVLFVGYSHNDPVMQYLARGLAPGHARGIFAFTPKDNDSHWEFLGISPLSYPLRKKPDEHGALGEAVEAWAELASMGAFEHEDRIKKMLTSAPPIIASEEDDYMRSVVEHEERVLFFTRHAKGTKWLLWAEERGFLTPLFSRRTDRKTPYRTLSEWFSREYVIKEPEQALGVFERQGQVLSQGLWYEIARTFHATDGIETLSLKKWLPILLNQSTPEDNPDLLEYLFSKTARTGSWSLVLQLFEHLTHPRLHFAKSVSFFHSGRRDAKPTREEVKILGSHYWLKDTLEKTLKPNMPEIAENLARICAQQIGRAHDFGVLAGMADREVEILCYLRSAIEPHSQDSLDRDFDIAIDTCRDSLEWLLQHKHGIARKYVEDWVLAPAPLLRRIAVHGMRVDNLASSEQKLTWAIKHELVASIALHHELYELLEIAYPSATTRQRRAFLDQARAVALRNIKEHPDEDPNMYWDGLFRILSWLDRATTGKCSMARSRLRRLQTKHPSFGLSDRPEFTHWMSSGRVGNESPISIEDLKKKQIKAAVGLLVTYRGKDFLGPNRDGLLGVFASAATRDPDWGVRVAGELLKRPKPVKDLWERLFRGWTEADLTEENWRAILNVVDRNPKLTEYARAVAQLLARGARNEKHHLPYSVLPLAERIGRRLWTVAVRQGEARGKDPSDWLLGAINETGGDLADFFIIAVSLRRKQAGTRWVGIPRALKAPLQRIVTGKSYSAEMGRVLLASRMHFLYSSDPSWTRRNIIPLLSWQRGEKQAAQAWQGYLVSGELGDEFLPELFPLYEKSFRRLDSELQQSRELFVNHVASICMFSTRKRARGTWLNRFLQSVSPAAREQFADSIGNILSDLAPDKADHAWREWLDSYWLNRISGRPVPLNHDEASKMAKWAPHFGSVFPVVVQRIRQLGPDLSADHFIYHMLNAKKIPEVHPRAAAELVSCLVSASYEPFDDYHLEPVLKTLTAHPETHDLLRPVIDRMAARGSLTARKYRDIISPGKPSLEP